MLQDKLIECVPNFSEGRDKSTIDAIAQSIESVPGVKILHIDMGQDAHRTVITFVGYPEACKEAAYRSILTGTQLIDMRTHQGAHPRIGAVDVFPFVPLVNTTMQEAIDCVLEVAQRVGSELLLPVYLYNESAKSADRKNLGDLRSGEYEGLAQKLTTPTGQPDFGPSTMNERSGALIIGARKILIAYNINLNTKEVSIAKKIASRLREKNGGLAAVRAIGWYMPEYHCAQVSTNLVDIGQTPLHQVFNMCTSIAKEYGADTVGSELIGLIPEQCLIDTTDNALPENKMSREDKVTVAINILGLNAVKPFYPDQHIIERLLNPGPLNNS
ncbi:MAG: glutamate formimidoyltransferase [Saprospiraceae bacterium]|nr:glutamate formimidoyltransferase [Saprospiraceae bacterium]